MGGGKDHAADERQQATPTSGRGPHYRGSGHTDEGRGNGQQG